MTLTELAERWQNTTDERATCECFTCRAMPAVVAALRELADRRSRQEPDDVSCAATQDRTDRELAKLEERE